jgi:hypothetical protein
MLKELKLIWDRKEGESNFAEIRLERKEILATNCWSSSEERWRVCRTGVYS